MTHYLLRYGLLYKKRVVRVNLLENEQVQVIAVGRVRRGLIGWITKRAMPSSQVKVCLVRRELVYSGVSASSNHRRLRADTVHSLGSA
jgi:hypothetical protein